MKKILSLMLTVCVLVTSLLCTCCMQPVVPEKQIGAISNIQNLSKVYDGEPVGKPSYDTNNTDGLASVTYYAKGSSEAVAAPANAGKYTVKISIAEGAAVQAVEATAEFTIVKANPVYSVPENLSAVRGDKLSDIDISAYGLAWVDTSALVEESGEFYAKIDADPANYVIDKDSIPLRVTVAQSVVELPTLSIAFDFDESEKSISESDIVGFDAERMEIVTKKSTLVATDIGTYSVTIRLTDSTACWSNHTNGEVVLTWSIGAFAVKYSKGTEGCYTSETGENGETVLRFTNNQSDKTVYQISGTLDGCIIVDVGDDYKFELELLDLTINSKHSAPIVILSGDKVTLTAKNGFDNFVYDNRDEVTNDSDYSSSVYSKVDLVLGGKGSLTVESLNNNGIHTKDDLEVKNLTLKVVCCDNALKGNDSVTITSGNLTLISKKGDGIKSSNSVKKYNSDGTLKKIQGTVAILDGHIDIYAACDGIDSSYDVEISGGTVNIYTDKYSPYSEEVTAVTSGALYIRFTQSDYKYSVKFYNSADDFVWENATQYKTVNDGGPGFPGGPGGRFPGGDTTYYYYKVNKPADYSKAMLCVYSASQQQGQDKDFVVCWDEITLNDYYDTLAITLRNGNNLLLSWTNFSTVAVGRPGGFDEGNKDKGDHSTKGIKADNEISISGGILFIKSYDDAIHANNDVVLGDEDDLTDDYYGTGNVNISGGELTLYTNDDGIHADGLLAISGGVVRVTNSYEGAEGNVVAISGGKVSIVSKDDGINGTATQGESIVVSGGELYVYAGGDGVDSNSRSSYDGILFCGGYSIIISTGNADSPIDTESGYKYTGGFVVAIGRSGGMSGESTKCNSANGFASVGKHQNVSASGYVCIADFATVKMPVSFSAIVIVLGSTSATISVEAAVTDQLDENNVCWKI